MNALSVVRCPLSVFDCTKIIALALLLSSTSAALAQQKEPQSAIVVIDPVRGAMVRWMLPGGALPRGGFRVERSIDGGARQTIATVKPGETTPATTGLKPERKKLADSFIADSVKVMQSKEAQSRLAIELLTLSDPALAAYLGLSYEDRAIPGRGSVVYTITRVAANGQAEGVHAVSPPTPIVTMPPPAPPSDLRGVASRGGIGLFWSPASKEERNPAAAVSYEVQKIDGSKRVPMTADPVLRLTSSGVENEPPGAIDRTPAIEATSRYTITALDIFGRRGAESASIEVFFPDFSALDPPNQLVTSTSEGKAIVSWSAAANKYRKGWKVVRGMQPEALGDVVGEPPLGGGTLTDANVRVGSTYYYRVSAINVRGEEGEPKVSQAVLVRSGKAPPAPTGLTAELKTGRVILSWASSPDTVAGYQVERSADGTKWSILTRVVSAEPRYGDLYPRDSTGTLEYRVIAWSFDDTPSAPSASVRVPLPDTRPPLPPIVTSISGAEGEVTLELTPGGGKDDASQFFVFRSESYKSTGVAVNPEPLPATATRFVDRAVEAGRMYFYRLVAVDAAGNRSTPSDPPSVIRVAPPQLPAPPTPAARFNATPFPRVIFEFTPSANASIQYALERQEPNGKWLMIQGPFPAGTSSVVDGNPPKSGRATYRLVTIASNGTPGPKSAVVEVAIPKR